MSFWHELAVAACLMLVLEGILPFVAPQRWRKMIEYAAHTDDRSMRLIGLACMLIGVVLLYLVN
ncbi:MAG: DUF2065 domain-containing protein [Pseudomonadales bacterium]